jgi:hypothetical protein
MHNPGDIETNPGPVKNAEIFLCDLPVTWKHVNVVMVAIYGIIDHVLNCARQIMNY